jgi:hypothetical protein
MAETAGDAIGATAPARATASPLAALGRALALPLHAAALASGAKSFRANPVIGSPALNARGLHVARIRLAERMAEARRRRLRGLVPDAHRDAFDRDGVVAVEDALPAELFARLRAEALGRPLPAREMRQGAAVTRFVDLDPATLAGLPALRAAASAAILRGLLRYAAATDGEPLLYLHSVVTDPARGAPDPQTDFHSDTFHAAAKAWLFLHDVAEADGPFVYVPGSHRLTPGRLDWERAQSLTAAGAADRHHAAGSFRAARDALDAMGYGPARSFPARANTLVVADTHGFHARGPALRPSVRVALYGSLRRNPFLPWTGLDPMRLPGLRGREGLIFGALLDLRERLGLGRNPQPRVGAVAADDPATRV